jgi:RNA polymerase sigma-32 factor
MKIAPEKISPEEQIVLARQYAKTGDPKLEERLVRSQIRLVAKMARAYGRDREDLIQEGCIGVVQALRHFDPGRRVRFSTYATWWIRAYQLRWLVSNHRLVKVGKTAQQRRIFFQVRALRAKLEAAGIEATPAELARHLGVDEESLAADLRCIEAREVPLETQELDSGSAVDDRLAAAETERLVKRKLSSFIAALDRRDRTIIKARWLREDPASLRELGRRLGVSRERVRQIESRLLHEMRERLPADLAA